MKRFLFFILAAAILAGLAFTSPAIAGKTTGHDIVVSADGDGGFTSIQAALDTITDASSTNRYRITVKPGVYSEMVTMKSYVDIVGSGQENTAIELGVSWSADSASLENIAVLDAIDVMSSHVVMRDVRVEVDGTFSCNYMITAGGASTIEMIDSRVILKDGMCTGTYGIDGFSGGLISGSIIDMTSVSWGWAVGLLSVSDITVNNTIITITGPEGSYGIMGDNISISNSKVIVESTGADGYGNEGLTGANNKVVNSEIVSTSVSGSYTYGINSYGGLEVNNSIISGSTLAIRDGSGSFKIGNSQIKGGHNGGSGDKIVNCYDENYNSVPGL